ARSPPLRPRQAADDVVSISDEGDSHDQTSIMIVEPASASFCEEEEGPEEQPAAITADPQTEMPAEPDGFEDAVPQQTDEPAAIPVPSHQEEDGLNPNSTEGARNPVDVYGRGELPTVETYDQKIKASALTQAHLREHNENETLRTARLLRSDQHLQAVSRRQVGESRQPNNVLGVGRVVTESLPAMLEFLGANRVGGIPVCPTCGQTYRRPRDLINHLRESPCTAIPWYDQGYEKVTERRFKCKFCRYEAMKAYQVVAHSNLDLGCRRCLLEVVAGQYQSPQQSDDPGAASSPPPTVVNDPLMTGRWTYSLEAALTVRAHLDQKRRRAREDPIHIMGARSYLRDPQRADREFMLGGDKPKTFLLAAVTHSCWICGLACENAKQLAEHLRESNDDRHRTLGDEKLIIPAHIPNQTELAMLIHQGARMIASIKQAGADVSLPAIRGLNALVRNCRRAPPPLESKDNQNRGGEPDPEKARRRIANRVNNALSFGAVSKALRALDDTPMIDIKSAQAKAALTALHPCTLPEGYVGVDYVPSSNTTGLEPATEEEMRKALFGTLNKKAPGASGLGPVQLKAMKQNEEFTKYLTQAYNELMTHPDAMSDVMALFEFRAVLIPKEAGGYRPIAIGETITNIFHRILLKRLIKHANYLSCEQIAFKKNAYPVGIRRAHELISRAGMQAISLDIKNAFNSVPRAEVIRALNEAGAPLVLIGYVKNFLELRHSEDVKCEVCGVPQGDPLSMFLFCMAFERFLRRLKGHGLTFLAYADDVVVFHDAQTPPGAIIQLATEEAAAMGLEIRGDKCRSTMNGDEVSFLNHPVCPEPASLASKAVAGAEEALRKILVAPITVHQKLILLSLCVVPMVNYAPLVEITSAEADYRRFDQLIAKSFTQITNRSCDSVTDFLAYPKEKGGLGLLMPGFFHKELRRVWASLNVNTGARDPVDLSVEGPALQEKQTYFNRLLTRTHQLPDRAATYCLQMCGLLTDEERAVKERHGSVLDHDINCPKTAQTRTARHDTIVRVYTSACRGAQPGAGDQDTQPSPRPEPEAGHLAHRQVQGHRRGRHPAPPDGPLLQREAQEVQGRDPPDRLRDGRLPPLSLAAPRRAPRGR
ncbi:Hypothetical protein GSB_155064, partial [Giardia duodenalis]